MRFDQPFIKLPIRFDAETLEREVRELPPSAWVPHPTGFPGNDAVRLVTVDGQPTDAFEGPMRPTDNLERMPYVRQIMGELGGVWSRSRLMGLGPGARVPEHVDAHYHWRTHVRIHIPIVTHPKVLFTCGDETVHMAPGECWLFDSFRWHRVENGWTQRRVHLVLDTVTTPSLRALVEASRGAAATRYLAPDLSRPAALKFEQINAPTVMSPWELRCHVEFILTHADDHPRVPLLRERLDRLVEDWAAIWAQFGSTTDGMPDYRRTLGDAHREVMPLAGSEMKSKNGDFLGNVLESLIFAAALAPPAPSGAVVSSLARERAAS
jgi:hypothetical protein